MTGSAPEPYLPLAGVRVLDLSRLIVGALTTRQLADLGAEVVKVEAPGTGDYLRSVPPFVGDEAVWFELTNRNKRSIELDLGDPQAIDTVLDLCQVADVVVEVSRPGALARLGLDLGELRRRRPELVVCSISPFGQTGPWAQVPGHGLNMDSLGGVTATRDDERGISRFVQLAYTGLSQEAPSLQAALAVTAALVGVRKGGAGAWIDISCWDALVELNRTAIAYLVATGRDPRAAEPQLWGPKHRVYRAGDGGLVFLAVIERRFWERFCAAVGRDDLAVRWDGDGELDYGVGEDLEAELEAIMASRTAGEWMDLFVEHGLPGSPLLGLEEVVASEHFAARSMLTHRPDGAVPSLASPIRWVDHGGDGHDRPGRAARRAPTVGADTADVLARWLGRRD